VALEEKLAADLKQAMLAKDDVARDTLRMLKAELMKGAVDLGRALEPAEELAVLKRGVKTRQESIEQYVAGGRGEAAERERKEIAVIERYLPKQLSEAETRELVGKLVTELGLAGKKDFGRLMKELKARYDGEYDGRVASGIAGELLK